MKTIWNGNLIAESNDIVNVEGNAFFPVESVKKEFLKKIKTNVAKALGH